MSFESDVRKLMELGYSHDEALNIRTFESKGRPLTRSEADANRELANTRDRDRKRNDGLNATLDDMFRPMKRDKFGFWK